MDYENNYHYDSIEVIYSSFHGAFASSSYMAPTRASLQITAPSSKALKKALL
jgi:hypothetical protein